jgi:MFS-type transporter involved in bile tolerance (Atg22 family)
MLLGVLTEGFGSQRAGMAGVLVMFVVGLGLLALVDEREGIRVAGRSD